MSKPRKVKPFIDKHNAVTFRLVHRSQKDPLIGTDAGQHVLAPVSDVQAMGTGGGPLSKKTRKEEEEKFGIYFDDDYDYLQHLRDVNEVVTLEPEEERVRILSDGICVDRTRERLISEPTSGKALVLPSSLFGTKGVELATGLLNQAAANHDPKFGWDPEIVAALDDDCEFDDPDCELEDDFVLKANAVPEDGDYASGNDDEWEDDSGDDEHDVEDADTIVRPDRCSHSSAVELGARIRRMDFSDFPSDNFAQEETRSRFTDYSMSSSVVPRTEGLKLLDDVFEKVYEAYDSSDEIGEDFEDDDGEANTTQVGIASNSKRMQELVDEFVLQKDSQRLETATSNLHKRKTTLSVIQERSGHVNRQLEKLLMKQMLEDEKPSSESERSSSSEDSSDESVERIRVSNKDDESEHWDCETILSTYTTSSNIPSLIKVPRKIKVNPKTGLPLGVLKGEGLTPRKLAELDTANKEQMSLRTAETHRSKASSYRPKTETAEERRVRKQAVKAERRERRCEKAANKSAFKVEEQLQKQIKLNFNQNIAGIKLL